MRPIKKPGSEPDRMGHFLPGISHMKKNNVWMEGEIIIWESIPAAFSDMGVFRFSLHTIIFRGHFARGWALKEYKTINTPA